MPAAATRIKMSDDPISGNRNVRLLERFSDLHESHRSHFQSALRALWAVLLDQSLEARIFAQRVPGWIELEHWDGETVGDSEQMIEKSKCFVEFPGPGINLGERSGDLRPIKGVLGFG